MKKLLFASTACMGLLATPNFAFAQDDVMDEEIVTPKSEKDYWIYADVSLATS
jgi:hypothetical protein